MSRAVQLVLLSVVILTCLQTGVAQHVDGNLSNTSILKSDINLNFCIVARIMGAIIEVLVPHINDIKEELRCIKNDLANLTVTVSNLGGTVSNLSAELEDYKQQSASELAGLTSGIENTTSDLQTSLQSNTQQLYAKMDTLDLKMVSVNGSMREELSCIRGELRSFNTNIMAIESQLKESQTASDLGSGQQTSGLDTSLQSTTEQLKQLVNMLSDDTSSLKEDVSSLNDSMNRISDKVGAHDNHMTTEHQSLQQKCTLQLNNLPVYKCGDTGGWRRVVYLDMTDPNTTCPSGWRLTSHSKRTCGRVSYLNCDSVTFPVSGGDYTRVCGRIIAYQNAFTWAFRASDTGRVTTINGPYVDGVSLTCGSPRQHIWTFAAGLSETYRNNYACPCDATINISIPSFVGGDYFCESGRQDGDRFGIFYPNNALWDGDGCTASSTCCSFNNPPYFIKQLSSPTSDDIEARLCQNGFINFEDTPIELLELYVQ